jgi:hypothetical protein
VSENKENLQLNNSKLTPKSILDDSYAVQPLKLGPNRPRGAAGLDDKPCKIAPECATSNISEHYPESVGTSMESVRLCAFYLDGALSAESAREVL